MKYLILIKSDARHDFGPGHHRLAAEMTAAGVYIASEGLADPALSRRVGGPGAVGADLAGFYLIDCPDLDEALGWAARVPGTDEVEVRPVLDVGGAEF